jgi:hypothetical protein
MISRLSEIGLKLLRNVTACLHYAIFRQKVEFGYFLSALLFFGWMQPMAVTLSFLALSLVLWAFLISAINQQAERR